jgi:hypothetical protein
VLLGFFFLNSYLEFHSFFFSLQTSNFKQSAKLFLRFHSFFPLLSPLSACWRLSTRAHTYVCVRARSAL